MRTSVLLRTLVLGLTVVIAGGCATSGRDDVINSTYRSVRTLEKNMTTSVDQLNKSTADLSTRLDASDQQTRELVGLVQETKERTDRVEAKLNELTKNLYKLNGLTPAPGATSSSSSNVLVDPVKVENQTAPGQPEPAQPAPAQPAPAAPVPGPVAAATPPAGEPSEERILSEAAPSPSAPAEKESAVAAYDQAMKAFNGKDYEGAAQQFGEFVKKYPNTEYSANAQFWKAQSVDKLGKSEEAIKEYEKVKATYPESPKVSVAMYKEAAAYLRIGQKERALTILKQLVENYPMTPAALQAKTQLQKLQGGN